MALKSRTTNNTPEICNIGRRTVLQTNYDNLGEIIGLWIELYRKQILVDEENRYWTTFLAALTKVNGLSTYIYKVSRGMGFKAKRKWWKAVVRPSH